MMLETDVLAQIRGLTRTRLRICIEQEWVRPARGDRGHAFDDLDVARLRLIAELTEDLQVNDDAVPIILSLVDQVHGLKRRLRLLDEAIAQQDDAVRGRIAEHVQARDGT
ncbi:chaperone modulator CbpM [Thalassobaculum sp.]|uniref:chaperone modulator CbpM n=1 Tax=Thalassobaculum sp. TaxID=2022740 RepID=UPI0032EBA991